MDHLGLLGPVDSLYNTIPLAAVAMDVRVARPTRSFYLRGRDGKLSRCGVTRAYKGFDETAAYQLSLFVSAALKLDMKASIGLAASGRL